MKRRLRLLPLLMLIIVSSIGAEEQSSSAEGILRIYRDARPELLGRAPDRSSRVEITLRSLADTDTLPLNEPAATAILVRSEIVDFLRELTGASGSGSAGPVQAEQIGENSFRISFPDWGIENSYRFDPPGPEVHLVIDTYYSNVYWKERVAAEYSGNYTVAVLSAEDCLNPRGHISFHEALLAASLIGAKRQPLWGIHDGLGLLDGLGYSLVESDNRIIRDSSSNREFSTNGVQMREILLSLRGKGRDLPAAVFTLVGSMVQYEEDDRFLLPEELLFEGEGDCLEFALACYDLLQRFDVESRVLALRLDSVPDEQRCKFIAVYRTEEFGPWGYMSFDTFQEPQNDTWEEIPARVMRDNVFYYPIDAEETMRRGEAALPPLQAWSPSIY
jgi:hypothetical protein